MGGVNILAILGKGRFSQELGIHTSLTFVVGLGSVMTSVGVSFSLLTCYSGEFNETEAPLEVKSAILDLAGSNSFFHVLHSAWLF